MGWNNLLIRTRPKLLEGITENDYFYFVHSYYVVPCDAERIVAAVDYGGPLAAVVQIKNLYGVQFHPEKSSKRGLEILHNFAQICNGK